LKNILDKKKLEFLNASVKNIFPGKNSRKAWKKKEKTYSLAMPVFFFPNKFVFFGQKYVE
jgi:hypothetical protein